MVPEETRARVAELAREGHPALSIAERLGIADQTVRKICRERGVALIKARRGRRPAACCGLPKSRCLCDPVTRGEGRWVLDPVARVQRWEAAA